MSGVNRARSLRRRSTPAEKRFWSWVRNRRFSGYKFKRQVPKDVYVLDFYCEEALLSVELDGGGHGFPGRKSCDTNRKNFLSENGIEEIRFWNWQIFKEPEVVKTKLFETLQRRSPRPLPDYTRPGSVIG